VSLNIQKLILLVIGALSGGVGGTALLVLSVEMQKRRLKNAAETDLKQGQESEEDDILWAQIALEEAHAKLSMIRKPGRAKVERRNKEDDAERWAQKPLETKAQQAEEGKAQQGGETPD
jgi:hypothetical protein